MARLRTIRVSALNVVSHPHSEAQYVDLFRTAQRRRVAAKYFGNKAGIIGAFNIHSRTSVHGPIFIGSFHLFTEFDAEQPWYDLSTGDQATEQDVSSIQLPDNLRPEFKPVSFAFFPKRHRLFFPSNEIAVTSAQRLVQIILGSPLIAPNIDVAVSIEQSRDQLDRLFAKERLLQINVTINRPNPDELGDVEAQINRRLEKLRSSKMVQEFTSEPGTGLVPDDELRDMSRVALSNGKVDVKFRNDQGVTETESTSEHPAAIVHRYNPLAATEVDAVIRLSHKFLDELPDV